MSESAELREALDAVRGRRIAVIGDAMVDAYIWGEATRISPEAPVPVVLEQRRTTAPGGAANAAANLARLGAEVELVAVAGDDAGSADIEQALREMAVEARLQAVQDRPTITKTRLFAGNHQVARIDTEATGPLPAEAEAGLVAAAEAAARRADAILISDYAKGVVTPGVARAVIGAAQETGKPVVIDPKGKDFSRYEGATVITPNEAEALAATAAPAGAAAADVAEALLRDLPGVVSLLITRGARGMILFERGREPLEVAAVSRRVFDVTGAGDTVAAVIAGALAGGASRQLAVKLANQAAALAVDTVGVTPIGHEDLRRVLGQHPVGQ